MLLKDAVSTFASGGGINNPLATVSASINSKAGALSGSTITSVKNSGDFATTAVNNANVVLNELLAQIKTFLPIMSAANNIYNELNGTTGQRQFFIDAFAPLTEFPSILATVDASLTQDHANQIAAETVALTTEQQGWLDVFNSAVSTASASISTKIAAYDSSGIYANSYIGGYAFAKFMTGNQPAHVQGVLSSATNVTIE